MTSDSSILATLSRPPQRTHRSILMPNTHFRHSHVGDMLRRRTLLLARAPARRGHGRLRRDTREAFALAWLRFAGRAISSPLTASGSLPSVTKILSEARLLKLFGRDVAERGQSSVLRARWRL